jgi:hypothetical protein
MTIKIKRQAMSVTTKQLRELADKLDNEANNPIEMCTNIENIKWNIAIINKQPKCSDTWEIEMFSK